MSERTLVDYLLNGMRRHWLKPVKHADGFTEGVPDVSAHIDPLGTVWVELKALKAWPKRPTTRVKFELSEAQRDFLWIRKGWLLVRVGREYLLFDGATTKEHIDLPHSTQSLIKLRAHRQWKNRIIWEEFVQCLKSNR